MSDINNSNSQDNSSVNKYLHEKFEDPDVKNHYVFNEDSSSLDDSDSMSDEPVRIVRKRKRKRYSNPMVDAFLEDNRKYEKLLMKYYKIKSDLDREETLHRYTKLDLNNSEVQNEILNNCVENDTKYINRLTRYVTIQGAIIAFAVIVKFAYWL